MTRNNPGNSSYFNGEFQEYGKYQWNIKYYGFENGYEVESALFWAFGEYFDSKSQFDYINEIVGRPVEATIEGRSGGWLVIHDELTDAELERVDRHVEACMEGLEGFLKEERQLNAEDSDMLNSLEE